MSATAHFMKVPVDDLDIVNGPGAARMIEITNELQAAWQPGRNYTVSAYFTLQTYASKKSFRRRIHLGQVNGAAGNEVYFAGTFDGKPVTGFYDMVTRKGHFSWA